MACCSWTQLVQTVVSRLEFSRDIDFIQIELQVRMYGMTGLSVEHVKNSNSSEHFHSQRLRMYMTFQQEVLF